MELIGFGKSLAGHCRLSPRNLLAMKMIALLMTVSCLQLHASSFAQQVTLKRHNASLEKIFEQIYRQTGYQFVYSYDQLKQARRVDIDVDKAPLREVLDYCFQSQPFTYVLSDKAIIVTARKTAPPGVSAKPVIQLSGNVTDSSGSPLTGVTIAVKNGSTGTVTGPDGKFSLEVPEDGVLIVSYVGYVTREIPVSRRHTLRIVLKEEVSSLNQLVVVGYGTQKKGDLTGSIVSVSSQQLTAYPSTSAIQALEGRSAGVSVQSVNGEPGEDYKIRVRGATSINASSDPLIVVDGLVGGVMPPAEDIASIEVLKDASATAIYGSRASNGVVIVTTKIGKPGKMIVSLHSSYSLQHEIGRLHLLNASQFAAYINEARGADFYDLDSITTNTDWQSLIFRTGYVQNHQLSLSGGSDKTKYYISGVYYDQNGVIDNSGFNRLSLTSSMNFDISKDIQINWNSIIQTAKQVVVPTQTGGGATNEGVVSAAERFDPNLGITEADGTYTTSKVGIAAFANPISIIRGRQQQNRKDNIQEDLKAILRLTKGLIFNSTFGVMIQNYHNGSYDSHITNTGINMNGLAQLSYSRQFNFLTEQYLNYQYSPDNRNHFDLTAGYSYQRFKNESFSASNAGFITDAVGYWNLGVGTNPQLPSSSYSESKIASFYGRLNYDYKKRYLLTATGRFDGASQFSEGHKWSFFPSGAFSWNVSNEDFYPKNDILSVLKLRTSYGLTGNQAIGPYESLSRISSTFFVVNNASVSSVRPTSIANKDLTWETTSQFDVGLDIELLQGRINMTGDYYYKKTHGLLFSVPIPSFSGYTSRLENLGEIENKGFEWQMTTKNMVNTQVKWTTDINLTFNKNRVLSLPNKGADIIYASAPSFSGSVENSILRVDAPVGAFFGYVYEGVYQQGDKFIPGGSFETTPGGEKYADLNGDGVLDSKDRKIIGNPNPDALWGLNNEISYKDFDVNIFFQGAIGGDILNLVDMELDRLSGNTNATIKALDRWTPDHTDTNVPKAYAGRVQRTSTRFVEDGTYTRLKNVSIGYNFPTDFTNRMKMSSARIYLSGQNLLTFTKYSGVDPEVAYKSSNTNLGLDFGSYPNTISYTIGLNLVF